MFEKFGSKKLICYIWYWIISNISIFLSYYKSPI